MPYPGWSMKKIEQYRSVKESVAKQHPKMAEDDVQAFAARIVNTPRKVHSKS